MKQIGIAVAWIAGLVLAGGLLFFFTQSTQNDIFVENVNKVLAQSGSTRQLGKTVAARTPLGAWYPIENSADRAFVFSIMHNGIFVPCIAFTSGGKEIEIFPLNNHAETVFPDIPKGVINVYSKRIEKLEKELK